MSSALTSSIQYLKGVGPKRAALFQKIGIETIEDVLYYFPRCYEDRSLITSIRALEMGVVACIKAEILCVKARRSFKKSFAIIELVVFDDSGKITAVWFNQPYLKNCFKAGDRILLYGRPEFYKDKLQISSPQFEILNEEEDSCAAGKIVPVYSLPEGISQKIFRKTVFAVLDEYLPRMADCLPFDIRSRRQMINIAQSLRNIHFPENEADRLKAYERLSFEEFFIYQIPLILRKMKRRQKKGIAFQIDEVFLDDFISSLPFSLTDSQKRVLLEIKADMRLLQPMQRLIQGDVGSGKTIVAVIAALGVVSAGFQAVFMVPTEILANQHYEKISRLLTGFYQRSEVCELKRKINVGLLTGSLSQREKKEIVGKIKNAEIDIVIGTHALLGESVQFKRLGLIVIDEQHKFGVSQRALLFEKAVSADVLIMTATPIPRTLSMTLYGDLDISSITELPKGRKKITSYYYEPKRKEEAYRFIKQQLDRGGQAYIVYPLIEENPKLLLASAKKMYQEFKQKIFNNYRLGLIHGKLSKSEQEAVMKKFRDGGLDVLIATTILEVGIDVSGANVILIEHAQMFGLSQLHQMRGRIGRGSAESFCLFSGEPNTEQGRARLKTIIDHHDGFKIAEEDLKIRGAGEFFGERQHGLTELKIADPIGQMDILKIARHEAECLMADDLHLNKRQNQKLKSELHRRFPGFEKFIEVG